MIDIRFSTTEEEALITDDDIEKFENDFNDDASVVVDAISDKNNESMSKKLSKNRRSKRW